MNSKENKKKGKKLHLGFSIGKVLLVALIICSLLMNACVLYVLGAEDFGSAVVINGKDGVDGKDGKDGINGIDGKDGKDGKNGRNGFDGEDGKDGLNGRDGVDGVDGKDGLTPYIGEDGMWWIGDTCTDVVASVFAYSGFPWDAVECGDNIGPFIFTPLYYDEDIEGAVYGYTVSRDGVRRVITVLSSGLKPYSHYGKYYTYSVYGQVTEISSDGRYIYIKPTLIRATD